MANPAGGSESGALRLDFDRRLTLQFRGSVVTTDAGLLAYRELDDALGLTALAGEMVADARTGKNGRHALVDLLRQSVFGRLAGYEDVNDAERLRHDPARASGLSERARGRIAGLPSLRPPILPLLLAFILAIRSSALRFSGMATVTQSAIAVAPVAFKARVVKLGSRAALRRKRRRV